AQKKAEALLAGERRLLEMVATGEPFDVLLGTLCRVAEGILGDCHCSAAVIDAGGSAVQFAPSLPPSYSAGFSFSVAGSEGSPCALAAQSNAQVIVSDAASDERWEAGGWRSHARSHGLAACFSTPVRSRSGSSLGTFAIYRRAPST